MLTQQIYFLGLILHVQSLLKLKVVLHIFIQGSHSIISAIEKIFSL